MKRPLVYLVVFEFFISICLIPCHAIAKGFSSFPQKLFFIENKNQIRDQNGKARNDIQFVVRGSGINIFVGNGAVHYQFYKLNKSNKEYSTNSEMDPCQALCDIETYRMDAELLGSDKNATFLPEQKQEYYENFFLSGGPSEGIRSQTYKKITYTNVYPLIDWVLLIKDDKLEQEFVVHPGGDISRIQLRYGGQTNLKINEDRSITAVTPMGAVTEKAPVCYFSNGSTTQINYKISDNVISYCVAASGQEMVIDPTVEWGTYYGPDSNNTRFYGLTSDHSANIYACGFTYSSSIGNIATAGSYQDTMGGNGDAYLVKFDSSGNRLWATFYGGSDIDWGYSVACDQSGNVYLGGFTGSTDTNAISTPGSHQPVYGGGRNGFLAKFNSSGTRIWGTYYGGDHEDIIYSVACDNYGHVYVAGGATSTFNISTPGSFEPIFINPLNQFTAGFLAQFDTSGVRHWGTYYEAYAGAVLSDVQTVLLSTDGSNVYISGWTAGTDSVVTAGCWQPVYGGGVSDDFVAKFDAFGHRLWATYYGGEGQELTGSVACDRYGNVFLLGVTYSDTGIASAGSVQPLRGGGADAFLAKLDATTGTRDWGTYFGGPADETVDWSKICTNRTTSVYITGLTQSTSGIASSGAWQPAFGGGAHDGFFAKYDQTGIQLWSTYYGGSGDDQAFACAFDGMNAYLCGMTNSPDNIATPGAFETTCDGDPVYNKGFLVKFSDLDSSYISLGTTNILTPEILLYPDPAFNFINVTGLAPDDQILVCDMTGRKITGFSARLSGTNIFCVNELPSGVYGVLVADTNGITKARKLLHKL